jgi:hypothetical protein
MAAAWGRSLDDQEHGTGQQQLLAEMDAVADDHRLAMRVEPAPCGLCGSPVVDAVTHRLFHHQLERLSGQVVALREAAAPNPDQW